VIIGHPQFEEEASENEVDAALRVYNSHLSRVEVVTYKQVVDRADRVLRLAEWVAGPPGCCREGFTQFSTHSRRIAAAQAPPTPVQGGRRLFKALTRRDVNQ
jgi:hypothetical protein